MCSCSVTIESKNKLIRKYGGNRSNVRSLYKKYKNLTLDEFLKLHKYCNKNDYDTLNVYMKLNKR